MEELPGAPDGLKALPAVVLADHHSLIWIGSNLSLTLSVRCRGLLCVDLTIGPSLVARQQSKDLLGGSVGPCFNSVHVCVCARFARV